MPPQQQNNIIPGEFGNLQNSSPVREPKKWFLLFLISFVLPPLGLILAIYLLYKWLKQHNTHYMLVALPVLFTAFAGSVIYLNLYYKFSANKPFHYSYSINKFDEYKLTSKLDTAEMTFNKPVEVEHSGLRLQEGSAVASLAHVNKKTKPASGVAYIYAGSVQSALATSEEYIKNIQAALGDSTHKDYETMITPVLNFIKDNTSNNLDIKIPSVTPLTTDNLKEKAWRFDFTINNGSNTRKINPLKGYAVMAIGKNTFYYFMITALDYNWQPNEKIWQQVLDSVKIDQ